MPAIERSCLLTTDIELLWLHYADTLRHWQRRFAANRYTIASLYDERFCRMFEFYLSTANWVPTTAAWRSSKSSSRTSRPLTRDYITSSERGLVGSNNKYRQARSGAPPSNTARKNQKTGFLAAI